MKYLGEMLLTREPFSEIVMGNTALVRAMVECGTRVVSSYHVERIRNPAFGFKVSKDDSYSGESSRCRPAIRYHDSPGDRDSDVGSRFCDNPKKEDTAMSEKATYKCKNCGKSRELSTDETIPVCCDSTMRPASALPVCEAPFTAEHSRFDDDDEPCDDGRAG